MRSGPNCWKLAAAHHIYTHDGRTMLEHALPILRGLGVGLLLSLVATPVLAAPGDFLTPEISVNETAANNPQGFDIASDAEAAC